MADQETAYEIGERVNVYDGRGDCLNTGTVSAIHTEGGEEFYDIDCGPHNRIEGIGEVHLDECEEADRG